MIPKPFDAIDKTDIEALVENQVREGRSIEYKKSLPGNSDENKREFLSDVSSFANAGGGDLLYGVVEADGIPREAVGLDGNMDSEMLRLENIVRDGLDPRIPSVRMKPVEGFTKGPVLLIRVHRSWAAPHLVSLKNLSRFFTRNSAGKHQMDVTEIRASFLLSEALPERMRRFRDERMGRIIANETPVPLREGAKLILHILPVASFSAEFNIDVSVLKEHGASVLQPIGGDGWNNRFNLDGLVTYSGEGPGVAARAYCQIFRSGQIEAVYADFIREREGTRFIASVAYEKRVIEAVLNYLGVLKVLEIPSPLFLFLSLTGVSGAYMFVGPGLFDDPSHPIEGDTLTLPDILIENYESLSDKNEVARVLRPVFDAIWNACGYVGSYNFDEKGNWNPGR